MKKLEKPEFLLVEDLGPRKRNINLKVKCISKNESREVSSKKDYSTHQVTQALIGDGTGVIFLTLWDDAIEKIKPEKSYIIKNAYTNIFKSSLRLNLGKYGELTESDEEVTEINVKNNLSEQIYESPRPSYKRQPYRKEYDSTGPKYDGKNKYRRQRRPQYKKRY